VQQLLFSSFDWAVLLLGKPLGLPGGWKQLLVTKQNRVCPHSEYTTSDQRHEILVYQEHCCANHARIGPGVNRREDIQAAYRAALHCRVS
jgi:hypothetical protein